MNNRSLLCSVALLAFASLILWGGEHRRASLLFPPTTEIHEIELVNSYILKNDGRVWRTADLLRADPNKVERIIGALGKLQKKALPLETERSVALQQLSRPSIVLRVTSKGRERTLLLGAASATNAHRFAKLDDNEEPFIVEEGIVQDLLQEEVILKNPLLLETPNIASFSVQRTGLGLSEIHFQRASASWTVSEKDRSLPGDKEEIESLIENLVKLTADTQLPSFALPAAPIMQIDFHLYRGEPTSIAFYERSQEGSKALLAKLSSQPEIFVLQSKIPTSLLQNIATFRDRTVFAPTKPRDVTAICFLEGERELFEIVQRTEGSFLSPKCDSAGQDEKPVATTLARDVLRLRALTYWPEDGGGIPRATNDFPNPPLHLRVKTREQALSLTVLGKVSKQESLSAPWLAQVSLNEPSLALFQHSEIEPIMKEIRLLETKAK